MRNMGDARIEALHFILEMSETRFSTYTYMYENPPESVKYDEDAVSTHQHWRLS